MKDGHPVGVETTEDVVFKLPGRHSVFQPPPPPQLTFESFINSPQHAFQNATPAADGPPEIRRWLLSQMQKDPLYSLWAKQGAFKSMKYDLPSKMVEIPTGVPTSRIYLITDNVVSPGLGLGAVLCGTGINCGIWLVEDDAGTIHGLGTSGCYFYVWQRKRSLYPDIFIAFSASHGLDIYGYVNAGGYWGLVYHGTILGTSHKGIHVFRHWHAPTLAAREEPQIPPTQQFLKLPPEVTATHLIKKVAPIYPAFAKAAGIQEVSRVPVVIYPDGHIHSEGRGPPTGWACLQQAAGNAAAGYIYRPFMKDGHPIYVETTEDIVFKLPGRHPVFRPPPAPQLTLRDFRNTRYATVPLTDVSPELRKWAARLAGRAAPNCLTGIPPFSPIQLEGAKKKVLAHMDFFVIPTKKTAARLYVVTLAGPQGCQLGSATGNAAFMPLVEDTAGHVRLIADYGGWSFCATPRKGSAYPDVFFIANGGRGENSVVGYANVGGQWGILYCGKLFVGQPNKGDIHLCRQ